MTSDLRRLTIGALGLAMVLVVAPVASAAPVSKCNAAKKKCIGKYVAAVLGCHAKAESKGEAVAPECIAKAVAKITGGGKGCFDKNDAKVPNDCLHTGDARQKLADADALVLDVVSAVDPAYPTPTLTKCGAARKKCAGKKAAGLLACSAKLNKDGLGDSACAPKVNDKFGGATGCDPKALAKGPDCLGSVTTGALGAAVDGWASNVEFLFDYDGPPCGNGVIDAGEFCDPAGPNRPEAVCGSDFLCSPSTCNCACPSRIHFIPDPTSSKTTLDLGWTGLMHRSPTLTNADVTVALSGCTGTEHPCGVCNLNGPIPNAGATELRNQRCSNDPSIRCTDDTPCTGGGGTCQFTLGSHFPLSAAGVSLCTVSRFVGPIAGTVNLETGAAITTAAATMRVYAPPTLDTPCPICVGDPTINDDVQGGTCSGGERNGLDCDANGVVPDRPDFGATSLDCPPISGGLLANLALDLSSATSDVVKTLSASSPSCTDEPGGRCLCDTCNNGDNQPCDDNADCPDPTGPLGPICGGRRCLAGPNLGAACSNHSQCPGATSACIRPGQPTRSSSCLDDTTTVGVFDCTDTAPVDGEGECTAGPVDRVCTAPHAQRFCFSNADCAPGTCVDAPRRCYLTGNGASLPGTGSLVASGEADPPMQETSSPVLGAVFCVAPTGSSSMNYIIGLPGPARWTMNGTATGRP